jgi:hypothetical protein
MDDDTVLKWAATLVLLVSLCVLRCDLGRILRGTTRKMNDNLTFKDLEHSRELLVEVEFELI